MLQLSVKVGQWVEIKGVGRIKLVQKSGQKIGLAFDTPGIGPITVVPLNDKPGDGPEVRQ
jgi:hypothetical protein